jgi:SpoVK/Ycf46/Vps4 family AAA+-type ATPase
MDEILALIKGRVPVIWVLTHEENRFIADFKRRIAKPHKRQVWTWSAAQGLVRLEGQLGIAKAGGEEENTHVVQKCLDRIATMPKAKGEEKGICYIMRDLQIALPAQETRRIRDMFEHLIGHGKTLIIVSPMLAHDAGGKAAGLPPTMEKQISVVTYELPDEEIIKTRVIDILGQMRQSVKNQDKKIKLSYPDDEMIQFARALRGLTELEVDNAISTSMTKCKELTVEKLMREKKQIVSRSDILEFIDTGIPLEDVGGLDLAKEYFSKYALAHTKEAQEFGVEPLKGVVLTGVPGTGKSLTAKMIGSMWKLPLLRLDMGKVMGSLVGQSEGKMRMVIQLVEAMAPCILWIDEVEKGLSGTKSSNYSDGGTLARVFGTLLHAMEDKMQGVTLVATANDISKLPPEFIRRFNETFFVDLPGPEEQWEILGIHLRKRGRAVDKFQKHKKAILDACIDYTGAEIEKSIKDAIAEAFCSGRKDVNHKDLLKALSQTKPIAKVMKSQIKKIRESARGQFRYASSWAEEKSHVREVSTKSGKKLNLSEALGDLPELVKTKKEKNKDELDGRESRFSAVAEED